MNFTIEISTLIGDEAFDAAVQFTADVKARNFNVKFLGLNGEPLADDIARHLNNPELIEAILWMLHSCVPSNPK